MLRRLELENEQLRTSLEDAREELQSLAQEQRQDTLSHKMEATADAREIARRDDLIRALRDRANRLGDKLRDQDTRKVGYQEELQVSLEKLRVTASELEAANIALSEANAELERRVARRTTELADINDRLRREEETLRLALRFAGAGTWDWNVAEDTVTWSDEYYELYGLEPGRVQACYSNWLATVHPDDRAETEARVHSTLRGDMGELYLEFRIFHPTRGIRWLVGRGRCIRDERGNPVRLIGLNMDVTERRGAEEAARLARDEAERANAAKSRFLAAASHDLRQPVQAASLFLGMLERRDLDHETRDLVGMVASSLEGLRGMLNGLLEVARLEAGIVDPKPREFPIDDLLQRLGAEFEEQARAKRLWLQIPPTSAIVSSDPLLLELILRNLISNAIKYTDRGGVTVECHKDDNCVRVEVIDTGRGIPQDKYQEIFEDFRQLDNPARDRARGFGLGLATVDRVARLLNYEISLRSELGHGSVFSFRVPLGADGTVTGRTGSPRPEERDDLAGRSILVVEDDPAILLALEMLLGDWGMLVHPAGSVPDVAAVLERLDAPPDVMAVDYRLPHGTSGTDAVTLVHRRWPQVPALLMTGDTAPERLTEAKRSGYRLLHKPVDPEDLRRTLVGCFEGC